MGKQQVAKMSQFNLNNTPLWTALVTPLTQQGKVDYACLAQLVMQQQAADNAIVLLGSTGEGLALTLEEQKSIVEFVISLQPTVPLMVAVGGFNLQQQKQWIEYCNTLPIHAYLLASPIYSKPGKSGQLLWFSELLRACEHPCMIYNVPSRSGINLDPDMLATLAEIDGFWAMKEASGSLERFRQYQQACPSVKLYGGDDGLFPEHAAQGAAGLVSVCANAWPKATRQFVDFHLSNRNAPLNSVWSQAADSMSTVANPIPVKVLMHHLEVINTPYLRSPLTHLELESKAQMIAANESVNSWSEQMAQTALTTKQTINTAQYA
ncbi:MAG: 4-hydroxy-tetrahydrodipicolinate synthase [Phenylobacterium sp.]|jgi:4-hydroxy-tetrahydrodipicolinate synthase